MRNNLILDDQMDALRAAAGSKSDYLPMTLDDAREDFIRRANETAVALKDGEVRPYHPAPMARQQKNTRKFCVKLGYGDNNAYFVNSVLKASQVLKYETAEEAASVIESLIIPVAEAGGFDDGLGATLEKHQKLAEARKAVEAANRSAFKVGGQAINPVVPAMAAE